MMRVMGFVRFIAIFVLVLGGCSHTPPSNKAVSPASLLPLMRLDGEGKARLEIGPESWVFSFDAAYKTPAEWIMSLQIPIRGEMVFAFPGLEQPVATIQARPDDFRWQVVRALRETSERRKLNYPTAGSDFMQRLHHLLRWLRPGAQNDGQCVAEGQDEWSCSKDGIASKWRWLESKQELSVEFGLRPEWLLVAQFKNPHQQRFQRVTLEIVRQGENQKFIELRQEIFFSNP